MGHCVVMVYGQFSASLNRQLLKNIVVEGKIAHVQQIPPLPQFFSHISSLF